MIVLGIESSCDETGVALVEAPERGVPVLLGHALHSQVEMHEAYGGVVPELASRDHIRRVLPLAQQVAEAKQFYGPILDRRYDQAPIRRRDLDQLEQISSNFRSRSAMLTELALDPPASTQDLAGPPLMEEDYLILSTIHSAKGCEWDVVYVIHAADGNIPSDMSTGSEEQIEEERRLFYVALTRTERTLFVSGHHWAESGSEPKGPSPFLTELHDLVEAQPDLGVIETWAPAPEAGTENPLTATPRTAPWPRDPLGARRADVERGAALVLAALDAPEPPPPASFEDDPDEWAADVDALLAERERRAESAAEVVLPAQMSVSQLVDLATDPDALAARLRRPLPFRPNPLVAGRAGEVRFRLAAGAEVRLEVLDIAGREVAALLQGPLPAGEHRARWDGQDHERRPVAAGVYLIRLRAEGETRGTKVVIR